MGGGGKWNRSQYFITFSIIKSGENLKPTKQYTIALVLKTTLQYIFCMALQSPIEWVARPKVMINSTEATAAIIGDILVFYNSNNLNCIGALSFYKDLVTTFYDY